MYKIFRVDEYGKNNISRKEFAVAVTWAEAALSVETQGSEVLTQCVDLTITVSMSQRELRWEGGVVRHIRSFLRRVKTEHNREWVSPQVSLIQNC